MKAVVVENYNSIDGISIKEIDTARRLHRRSPRQDRRRGGRLRRRIEGAGTLSDQGSAAVRAGHGICRHRRRRCRRRHRVQAGHARDRHDPFRRARRIHLGAVSGAQEPAAAGSLRGRRIVSGQLSDRALRAGCPRLAARRRNIAGAGRRRRRRHRRRSARQADGRAGDRRGLDGGEARLRGAVRRRSRPSTTPGRIGGTRSRR